jgi:hypothetical protein
VRRAAALLALLVAPLLATACAGPQRPVQLGVKEVPSDVVLGGHGSPSAAPSPMASGPAPLPLPPVSVVALPPPTFSLGPEPAPPAPAPTLTACPSADPLQAPALEAPPQISTPPAKASYVFRDVGTYSVSGADTRTGRFPTTSRRVVGNVVRSSSGFSYDVSELLGDVTTTTTYDVVTSSLLPAALPTGLYLKQVTSIRGPSRSTFAPTPELELAAFPLVRGAAVTSAGTDPASATSMQFTSTVTGKARVNACGTPLDSWVLDLSKGRLVGPTQDLDFAATYALGTQYGGLPLRERTAFAGTDGSDGVSRTNTATITTTPKAP